MDQIFSQILAGGETDRLVLQVFVLMQFGRKKDWPHGKEIPDYKAPNNNIAINASENIFLLIKIEFHQC